MQVSLRFRLPTSLAIFVLFVVLAFGAFPNRTAAQSGTDGTIYSRFGLGLRQSFHSPKAQAMGGGGVALRSVDVTNHFNPASLYDQVLTRLAGGFVMEGVTETADGAETSKLRSGYISSLQLSFPLKVGRVGLGLSFEPYTRMGYRVDTAGTTTVDPERNTIESYTNSFRGNGGIQRLSAGIGVLVRTGLSLGLRSDFLFGIVEESQQTDFQNINFRDGSVISGTRLRGVTATLGLRYVVNTILNDEDQLAIGATYTLPVALSAERIVSTGKTENADTLGQKINGDVELPMSLAAGMAYKPNPKWTIIADVEFEQWSSFKSDLSFAGYEVGNPEAFRDRVRFSTGIEFHPGARVAVASFLQALKFRIGTYVDQLYVSPDASRDINSFGFTGGISIPSKNIGTSLDINMEVGQRGTSNFGLINDRFVRIGINLSFGERWFDRARLL